MTEEEIKLQLETIEAELEAADTNDDTDKLLNDAGVGYYLLGEYGKAITFLEKAVTGSNNVQFEFNLANSYSAEGKSDLAISTYLKVLESEPAHIGALNNLADEYEQKGDVEKAHELFHYLTHIQPDEPLSHFNLGNFFLRQNQHIEAGNCYESALRQDPDFIDAYYNIAWILYKVGAYSESLEYIDRGLKIEPDRSDLISLKKKVVSIQDDTVG